MSTHQLWNPWHELERFQNEVNQLFSWNPPRSQRTEALPVNVWVGEEGAILTAMIPGAAADSLDISILGETLTLRGLRKNTVQAGEVNATPHRLERPTGDFARTVQLPFRVDAEKVVANYNQGVLELMLPRAAEDKPQRIAIKAA